MGGAVSSVIKSVTGLADDLFEAVGLDLIPSTTTLEVPKMEAKNVEQLPGINQRTAEGIGDSDSKRKKLSKKRLGTKQLQIPLANTKDIINIGNDIGVN